MRDIVVDKADGFLRALLAATLIFFVSGATALGVLMALFGRRSSMQAAIGRALGVSWREQLQQCAAVSVLIVAPATVAAFALVRLITVRVETLAPVVTVDAFSWRTTSFTGALALCIGALIFAVLVSARRTRRGELADLRAGGRVSRVSRGFLVGLLGSQVAVATLQLSLAQVAVLRLAQVAQVDLGFDVRETLTLGVEPSLSTYPDAPSWDALFRRVRDALVALPGVESVGAVNHPPLVDRATMAEIDVPGVQRATAGPFGSMAVLRAADDDYLRASRHRVVRGEPLTSAADVAVVNESLVRTIGQGTELLGRTLTLRLQAPHLGTTPLALRLRVVGVVADARDWGAMRDPLPLVYVPSRVLPWPSMHFVIRTGGNAAALIPSVRRAVTRVDATLPVAVLATTRSLADGKVASYRAAGAVVSIFAAVVIALVVIGQTIVTWVGIREREGELAVHAALGASPGRLAGSAMRPVLVAAAAGVAGGLWLTPLMGKAMRVLLQLPERATTMEIVGPAVALFALSLLAAASAAWRVREIDPARALRSQ
jgi:hypothetical protein